MADDIKIRITADASGVKTGTAQVKQELTGIQAAGSAMASGLRTSMLGISLAMAPVIAALTTVAALKGFVKIADDAIEADNKVKILAGDTAAIQPTISGAFNEIRNAVVRFSLAVNAGTGIVGAIGRVMREVAQVIAIFAKQLSGAGTESDKLKAQQGAAEFARNVGRFFAWAGDIVSAVARVIIDSVSTIVGAVKMAGQTILAFAQAASQLASGNFTGAAATIRTAAFNISDAIGAMVDKGVADLTRLKDAILGNGAALDAYQSQVAMGTSTDLSTPGKPAKDGSGGGSGGGDNLDELFAPEVYARRMKDLQEKLRTQFVSMPVFNGGKGSPGQGGEQGILAGILGAGLQTLPNTFGSALDQILTRSRTFGQAMAGVWSTMRSAIINEIGKIILAKIAAFVKERGIALAQISANAATAGSGAASSVASIPYVGPILAIAAMAAVLGAVLGLGGGIKSAAGGFDIPSGLNPVTQLHAEEMVLPADIANPLRQGLAGGGGVGGPPIVLQGVDGGEFFLTNKSALVKALKAAHRDGAFA